MNVSLFIKDLRQTPAQYLIPKFFGLFQNRLRKSADYRKSLQGSTFHQYPLNKWNGLLSQISPQLHDHSFELLKFQVQKYLTHEFIPFGTDWKHFSYSENPQGFNRHMYPNQLELTEFDEKGDWIAFIVNETNLDKSRELWQCLRSLNSSYQPIDWSRDIRSGYRYSGRSHFSRLTVIAPKEGVDVKCLWDLGRLQHLPGLALHALLINENKEVLRKEIICQILDFQLQNPPEFGVHWTSAMEVSMRLFNLCTTMDLLRSASLINEEDEIFAHIRNYMIDHLSYAYRYREHKNGLSNNHYLANLVGILYGVHCLNDEKWTTRFSDLAKDFLKEVDKQFLNDGGNFESSIPYHFFSSEIAALGLTLVNRIRPDLIIESIGQKAVTKLHAALQFCEDVMIHDGRIPQVGDNDSARMLYFYFEMNGDLRDQLNYNSSYQTLKGLFEEKHGDVHSEYTAALSKGIIKVDSPKQKVVFKAQSKKEKYQFTEASEYMFSGMHEKKYAQNLSYSVYPDFGIVIFKNQDIYLLMNGTNRHVKQYWPHGHNDKLSIELWVNGHPVLRDPGSYTYTGSPELRNRYRSNAAHATILVEGKEQNEVLPGLTGVFRMLPSSHVQIREMGENFVEMALKYGNVKAIRKVSILSDRVKVEDQCNMPFTVNKFPEIRHSNGYGSLEKEV